LHRQAAGLLALVKRIGAKLTEVFSMWKRINKREARKIWNNGGELKVVPCKANINSLWFTGLMFSKNEPGRVENDETDFDKFIDYFTVYNCCNELGRYAAYYIEVE
jgi:hypothetical protein